MDLPRQHSSIGQLGVPMVEEDEWRLNADVVASGAISLYAVLLAAERKGGNGRAWCEMGKSSNTNAVNRTDGRYRTGGI